MMDWKRQCAAVIPCFNEAGRIAPVIGEVRRHLPNVIVVDDGSSDSTQEEAAKAGAIVLRRSANGGKGSALRAGWRQARRAGFTWALSLDGDGQHAADDIPEFFACAERTAARLVIGNRMGRVATMPRLRRWANSWMSRCLSNLTGAALPDSQCGFRLAHLDTVLQLPLAANRFVIESETLVAFLAAGERVAFVPVQVIYGPGRSKICPVRDTWRWMRWWTAQLPATA
jgi:glycosyltransferase involved in cell wall biosynthesis